MGVEHWVRIASDIASFYEEYDGFVIIMGTDTLGKYRRRTNKYNKPINI